MKSKFDKLIQKFINDSNYIIMPTGEIMNSQRKKIGYTKKTELKLRNKQYYYVKYKGKELKAHRIIYCKFVGPLLKSKVVHHEDSNGLNNCVTNLDLITQKENLYKKENQNV